MNREKNPVVLLFFCVRTVMMPDIVPILPETKSSPFKNKSITMKVSAHPSLYFSAYPLRVIKEKATTVNKQVQSPYLRSILSGKNKTVSRVRVFPMVNPYAQKLVMPTIIKKAKEVDPSGREWFSNYE